MELVERSALRRRKFNFDLRIEQRCLCHIRCSSNVIRLDSLTHTSQLVGRYFISEHLRKRNK